MSPCSEGAERLWGGRATRGTIGVLGAIALLGMGFSCSPAADPSGEGGAGGGLETGGAAPGPGGGGASTSGGSGAGAEPATGATGGTLTGGADPGESSGGAQSGAGGAPSPRDCENDSPALAVKLLETKRVSELGTLFSNQEDSVGPRSWQARYGKAPEIVPVADGDGFAVLLQDQSSGAAAHVVHLAPSDGEYAVDAVYEVESLGRIMGLALDEKGNDFVATGVDEDDEVDATYPPNDIPRPDVVRLVKFDRSGCVLGETDVDMARREADPEAEIIVNPMVAGSSRLAYGAGHLLLVHSHNTEPDENIGGTRHQKAIATHINAETGAVTRASTMWVSHSFDQRALFDGTGFVELHLGDAYPRTITVGRYPATGRGVTRDLFHIKGPEGDNNTFMRLGGIAQVGHPEFDYLVLFATERSRGFEGDGEIRGTRDLALVRVRSDFEEVEGSVIERSPQTAEFTVVSSSKEQTNHVRWLTDLGENRHVERPRIVAAGGGAIALWEEWTMSGMMSRFEGVYALSLGADGEVIEGPEALPGAKHISRGDDAISVGGRALYVSGSAEGLVLNFVAPDLSFEQLTIP